MKSFIKLSLLGWILKKLEKKIGIMLFFQQIACFLKVAELLQSLEAF